MAIITKDEKPADMLTRSHFSFPLLLLFQEVFGDDRPAAKKPAAQNAKKAAAEAAAAKQAAAADEVRC